MIKQRISVLAVGLLFLIPTSALAETNEEVLRQTLIDLVYQLQTQLEGRVAGAYVDPSRIPNVTDRYQVVGGVLQSSPVVAYDHRLYWQDVARVFPDRYQALITEYVIYDDPYGVTDAYIETIRGLREWRFGVNFAYYSPTEAIEIRHELLVHELAHIVITEADYLTDFTDTFWSARMQQVSTEAEVSTDPLEAVYTYYRRYADQFVSEYAATNPEEDWAETFATFVMTTWPSGDSIAEQKVRYLYRYAELTALRLELRSRLGL